MKITICGSMAFYDEMIELKSQLERMTNQVRIPPAEVLDDNGNLMPVKEYYELRKKADEKIHWIWERKKEAMLLHFNWVNWSNSILVANYDKNNIPNYIGANTFLEMGLALYLNKGIYLLNPIPEIDYKEEILGMQPIIINRDLSKIK